MAPVLRWDLLVLGCLLEGSTIILVIVPVFIPTAKALGIEIGRAHV